MAKEGTNAGNNPLATTLPWAGATDFNSVGVKNYPSFNDGVAATAQTLRTGYPAITGDLRAGNGDGARHEHFELGRWSGGGYTDIDEGGGGVPTTGGSNVSGDGWLEGLGHAVGEFLIDALGLIGLGLGGGQAAAAPWLDSLRQDAYQLDPTRPLQPAEAAVGVVKSQLTRDDGANEASQSGINRMRFDKMVDITGNPPGPETLLEMLRRGIVSPSQAELGMREGFLRNEWVAQMMNMENIPLNTAEAVQAAVQNHMPYETAKSAASLRGTSAAEFEILYQVAGNPPGPHELLDLWVRGYIDEATVDQGLRESRLKNKWIEPLKNLAVRRIPLRTITALLNNGAIDDATAVRKLRELGYTQEDADALIRGHKKPPTAPHRELSVAQIRDLYEQHMVSRDEAVMDLIALGYNAPAANELLQLVDTAQERQLRKAAVSRVRAAYHARKINRATASADLDALAVPATLRDEMLQLWDLELSANTAQLTPTDICAAGKVELFTPAEVLDRLVAHGYSPDDAVVFAMIHHGIPLPQAGGA